MNFADRRRRNKDRAAPAAERGEDPKQRYVTTHAINAPPSQSGGERVFAGALSDDAVHWISTDIGREQPTAALHLEGEIAAFPPVHKHILGADVRAEIQTKAARIRVLDQQIGTAVEDALQAVDAEGQARAEHATWEVRAEREGVGVPVLGRDSRLPIKLAGLMVADGIFISIAYQVLPVSPIETYGIALGSILAVALLGEEAGKHLKHSVSYTHAAMSRRAKANEQEN